MSRSSGNLGEQQFERGCWKSLNPIWLHSCGKFYCGYSRYQLWDNDGGDARVLGGFTRGFAWYLHRVTKRFVADPANGVLVGMLM